MKSSFLLFAFLNIGSIVSCGTRDKVVVYQELIKDADSLVIKEGFICEKAQKIKYLKNGKLLGELAFSDPIKVAQADREEEWGYFQFPIISKSDDNTLVVTWQMKDDSHTAYGVNSGRKCSPMMSKDDGNSWAPQDKDYFAIGGNYNVRLNSGEILEIYTPQSRIISEFIDLPKPIAIQNGNAYYLHDSLPDVLQGTYFNLWNRERHANRIHAKLNDHDGIRASIGKYMPVIWWGSIKQLADNSLLAGVYPGTYYDSTINEIRSGIAFYNSIDNGLTWSIRGRITYKPDGISNIRGENEYSEPAYEILKDSSLVCVMRSGSQSPMYQSFSYDMGVTWTDPIPITPNGVRPWLLKLRNGVLVLVSGRPGIQVRFCFDGSGKEWSDPIDMQSFMHSDGSYSLSTTCGYASIVEAGENSFYLVYSDFTTRNVLGEHRKSIWFRKVTVDVNNTVFRIWE